MWLLGGGEEGGDAYRQKKYLIWVESTSREGLLSTETKKPKLPLTTAKEEGHSIKQPSVRIPMLSQCRRNSPVPPDPEVVTMPHSQIWLGRSFLRGGAWVCFPPPRPSNTWTKLLIRQECSNKECCKSYVVGIPLIMIKFFGLCKKC